jgi:hypothetical protein
MVPTSSFYDPIRSLIGDDNPDIQTVSNAALDSKIRLIINSGKVHGYIMDSTGLNIMPGGSSSNCYPYQRPGYYSWRDWDNYAFGIGYGSMSFLYGNPYNVWWDQSFDFYIHYVPLPANYADENDLTPTGNCRGWTRLVYEVANKFVSGMSNYHFRTRSVTETIAAPKDMLIDIQLELDSLINGGRASERPAPLPILAIGIRSLWGNIWSGFGVGNAFVYSGYSLDF